MKILLVFYFDNTVIDDNTDTSIVKCAPEKKLPVQLENSYQKGFWTEFMGRVFKYLGEKGIREEEMKRAVTSIPFTPGMVELLSFIRKHKDKFDCIIISDSNSIFIDWPMAPGGLSSACLASGGTGNKKAERAGDLSATLGDEKTWHVLGALRSAVTLPRQPRAPHATAGSSGR
ncbi:PREDICTED: pyridoxal phosphate phosphatase PHOSPHO2-like [Elephantulus edwardii]|uniref:pyridoxal phosphate phosphatase PHOSPHO2-like n=1 Tax=Elephantulus edwardii TaxID=28737 RepID=UPI0003F0769C|nr:PREDICTED: pyridoxal phosphate phosphatase PHOSPHO2-like [Elephantulus edwardii]